MQKLFLCFIAAGILCFLALPTATHAQSDSAKIYKTNCVLCHSANGSGDSPSGKALHAKDLRSEEVQKQSDAALSQGQRGDAGFRCQNQARRCREIGSIPPGTGETKVRNSGACGCWKRGSMVAAAGTWRWHG